MDDFPLDDFDRMIAVNVRAVFVAIQAAAAHDQRGLAYLAGPESSFVTGASLTIDGGYLA